MNAVILILVMATSNYTKVGAASTVAEFSDMAKCQAAGLALTKQAQERQNYVLTWGCFPK